MVVAIRTEGDFLEKLQKHQCVLAWFTAPWCGPCRKIKPFLYEQADNPIYKNIEFAEINIDDNPELQMRYNVNSIPTIIMFVSGVECDRITGSNTAEIKKVLDEKICS